MRLTEVLKMVSKPAAWGSGWTSSFLCFSAASGYGGLPENIGGPCAGLLWGSSKLLRLLCKCGKNQDVEFCPIFLYLYSGSRGILYENREWARANQTFAKHNLLRKSI